MAVLDLKLLFRFIKFSALCRRRPALGFTRKTLRHAQPCFRTSSGSSRRRLSRSSWPEARQPERDDPCTDRGPVYGGHESLDVVRLGRAATFKSLSGREAAMARRVLNVGCGTDNYGTHFVDIYPLRKGVLKCDVSRERLPFRSAFFDEIYCRGLFEHLNNPLFFLRECRRVLKKKPLVGCDIR